jgi:hypothetical protein
MTTSRELLQQALDDLLDYRNRDTNKTIEAIRAHLAKEPEPVAWQSISGNLAYSKEAFTPSTRVFSKPLYRKEDM